MAKMLGKNSRENKDARQMRINTFFDKVYCINLAERKDKWREVCKELIGHNIGFDRFEGINGHTCGLEPGTPPYIGWDKISLGSMGCLLSHLKILEHCKETGVHNVLIFEDDVALSDDFNDVAEAFLDIVPDDWDMIYFGANHSWLNRPRPPIKISELLYKCTFTLTTHAVAVNSSIYDGLIADLSSRQLAVDVCYGQYHEFCNAYTPHKRIAWQRPSFSDVEQRQVDYRSVLKDAE